MRAISILLVFIFLFTSTTHAAEKDMFIDYNGYKVAYHDAGRGQQTLLFIHGLPLSSQSWQCQVEFFKHKYRVVTVDLPGYGQSSPLKNDKMNNLSEFYADSIHAVLKELKINKVVYIGFATGGHVGMMFAKKHANLTDKLILINTSPQFATSRDWPYGFDKKAVDYFNQAFDTQSLPEIAQTLLKPAMQENCQAQLTAIKKLFTKMTVDCGVVTLKAFFNNIAYENYRPLLSKIKAKTLIIQSSLDKEVVPAVALYMRQHIKDAQLVEINGADHFVFATRKELFNQLVENFVNPKCQICKYNI
ncbi:chloroperoxidase [Legionella spiritensis]|uniref:Chloroperoxidase n=2 Tax=Legionella spiritensis TaxID=452 RepID=A0A0W0Z231_LEGSP|nr:chloroperoxidase [Legionella spiritensis]SNV45391.1 biotin operon repressor and biotin [Legionella spiritensis]